MKLNLFYARKDVGGGSTSFAVHLFSVLRNQGVDVRMLRFCPEGKAGGAPRTLGGYAGVPCHRVDMAGALAAVRDAPSLLVAPEHSKRLPSGVCLKTLMRHGLRVVLHDPNEFKVFDHLEDKALVRAPICIRPTYQRFFPSATFIPHPYVREFSGHQGGDLSWRGTAATLARITFVKRPEILMLANRLLPEERRIVFHGAENRLFTFVKFKEQFPEFTQGGHNLPLEWGVSARAARAYAFMIDMTYFPDDGGGSQYTFMEAWDAGSVVVVHEDWLRYPGEMQRHQNCLAVNGPEALAALLKRDDPAFWDSMGAISAASTAHLESVHGERTVAEQYVWNLAGETL